MTDLSSTKKIHYALRIAVAMCFIGHGAFGIITKAIWVNYFAVFGIGHDLAYKLMPAVGSIDILLGIVVLIYPIRIIPAWLIFWGILTASLRPLSGEPFAELIERAGNFGAPLTLLLLSGTIKENLKSIFKPIDPNIKIDQNNLSRAIICLRIIVFLLFLGHGWLNLIEKKVLIAQYTSLGFSDAAKTAMIVGWLEIVAAFTILIKPVRSILLIFFFWKMASELFYPHYEIFEWVERGGSYGCILALWFSLEAERRHHLPKTAINFPGFIS